jgi:hypothetical protein
LGQGSQAEDSAAGSAAEEDDKEEGAAVDSAGSEGRPEVDHVDERSGVTFYKQRGFAAGAGSPGSSDEGDGGSESEERARGAAVHPPTPQWKRLGREKQARRAARPRGAHAEALAAAADMLRTPPRSSPAKAPRKTPVPAAAREAAAAEARRPPAGSGPATPDGVRKVMGRPPLPPPPPSRTKWTRLVHPFVLIGHISSLPSC